MANANAVGVPWRVRGFTMIELMTAIAVAAILLTLAIPSFTATINRNRLATAANELVTSLQLARMEAVRRGAPVVVCASADVNAANPTCNAGSWEQWLTFVDANGNGTRNAGEPLLRTSAVNPNVLMVAGGALATTPPALERDKVVFRPDGLSYASTGALLTVLVNACIKTSHPEVNGRNVQVRSGSSILVEDAVPDPECTVPG